MRRWRAIAVRFMGDEEGTSMTEFVITLPLFLIVFSGLLELSQICRTSVRTEVRGYNQANDRVLEAQQQSLFGGITSPSNLTHASPTIAAIDATRQVEQHPPRQQGIARQAIRLYENRTYTLADGLSLSGHWGQARARLQPLEALGTEFLGVNNALTAHPRNLTGESQLASDLLYDGPNKFFNAGNEKSKLPSQSQGLVTKIMGYVNGAVDMFGARAAIAANMRYGTVTGVHEDSVNVAGSSFGVKSYYTYTVPPYASGNAWRDQSLSVLMTRLTMYGPEYGIYQEPLQIPNNAFGNLQKIDIPSYDDTNLSNPLNYDQNTRDILIRSYGLENQSN